MTSVTLTVLPTGAPGDVFAQTLEAAEVGVHDSGALIIRETLPDGSTVKRIEAPGFWLRVYMKEDS